MPLSSRKQSGGKVVPFPTPEFIQGSLSVPLYPFCPLIPGQELERMEEKFGQVWKKAEPTKQQRLVTLVAQAESRSGGCVTSDGPYRLGKRLIQLEGEVQEQKGGKKRKEGAGAMAQWLRALAVLAEGLGSVPSTNMVTLNPL